nr:BMC domain-containing protein [uncultured Cohaesibacter sp.]
MPLAIGILELSSIAAGYKAEDGMLKAADVKLLVARTICPGKFIVVIGGNVSAVQTALKAGEGLAAGFLVDQIFLPNVDPQLFPALTGSVETPAAKGKALGIIETFSSSSIVRAGDAAAKAANVSLLRVHIAMAVGGKGFLLLSGDVGAANAAIKAGIEEIRDAGILVNHVVISNASQELFSDYI